MRKVLRHFLRIVAAIGLSSAALQVYACDATRIDEPQVIKYDDGSTYQTELHLATENSGERSYLIWGGGGSPPACVELTVTSRAGANEFTTARISPVVLGGKKLIAIRGSAVQPGDCCELLRFLRIDPATGELQAIRNGDFRTPHQGEITYGISKPMRLTVLTAIRVLTRHDDDTLGSHHYRITKWIYASGRKQFVVSSSYVTTAAYDLVDSATVSVFGGEHLRIR